MNKWILRGARAPCTLAVDDETRGHEPVILGREGRPGAALVPIVEYEAFRAWRKALEEPWPEEPPPTPEGDLEALAAVGRIRTMLADTEPEIWRDVIEDELLSPENLWILLEENDE